MGAQKQGTGKASAAMMAKFIKDHKRLQVALAGYSVVGIFILSYLLANQIQDWFGRSAVLATQNIRSKKSERPVPKPSASPLALPSQRDECAKKLRTGKPLLNEHASSYLDNQIEG